MTAFDDERDNVGGADAEDRGEVLRRGEDGAVSAGAVDGTLPAGESAGATLAADER